MKRYVEGLLAGIRVLDFADEQGSFCSKLLADLGATVVKIEDADGDPSRASQYFHYHNLNKLGFIVDWQTKRGKQTFRELLQNADVLVESFGPGRLRALGLEYSRLQRINPQLIHISITGFGRTGPKRSRSSFDSIQAAEGGQMHVTGIVAGKPLKLYGPQTGCTASLFGANAALLGLLRRNITGRGSYIDLSIQECVASVLDPAMTDYFCVREMPGYLTSDTKRDAFLALPCRDGHVEIPVLRNWETILELANPKEDPGVFSGRKLKDESSIASHRAFLLDTVRTWTAQHTKKRLFDLGQAMGFPWAPVALPNETLRSAQLKSRRFFVYTKSAGKRQTLLVPSMPYKFSGFSPHAPSPAPAHGEHMKQVLKMLAAPQTKTCSRHRIEARDSSTAWGKILQGIRVLDFTRMLSGPYATRILADFGAEVIKVQSRSTATGAEQNYTPQFLAWNRNKRSFGLNLNHPEAKNILLELVAVSDVIVENFSPRVMQNWGLTFKVMKKVKPDLIMASLSAMGQTGPWKNFVGFAETFHALSGLTYATCRSLDSPIAIGSAYGDFIAGLYAALAILSSLVNRDRTGKGQFIDLSAYEALCTFVCPLLFEFPSAGNRRLIRSDEETDWGCYPCAGKDRWCVIVIRSENEWQSLREIAGLFGLGNASYSAWMSRGKIRKELDEGIAQWTKSLAAALIVRRLQKAGIAAGIVQSLEDLANDPQLTARHFFTKIRHSRTGAFLRDRSALWPWNEPHVHWKEAPELGEANRYLFVELLGHPESEYRAMAGKGILENKSG
jgi:crotonobetainyl-CoA:carnitine CoA-transferase CaiB-like acyl-CoA transferase